MPHLLVRRYVYDSAQRILHWWIGLATLLLILTGLLGSNQDAGSGRAFMWDLHIIAGNVLIVGVVGRLVWGLIGSKHARFHSLFHFKAWIQTLKSRRILSADRGFGHHAQASAAYLGYYILVIAMCVTGLALAGMVHGEGILAPYFHDELTYLDIIRESHGYGMWMIVGFIVTHIGAIIFHEWHDGIPVAQSIVSGFQYRTVKEEPLEKGE
jgi:Ni/Fe-hydrogenase 1 B-type cytochrome subunit